MSDAAVLDRRNSQAPAIDAPLLSVRGLTKIYGGRAACREVTFDLWPGEVLAVVGESGAGKTTVLKCLSGHVGDDRQFRTPRECRLALADGDSLPCAAADRPRSVGVERISLTAVRAESGPAPERAQRSPAA